MLPEIIGEFGVVMDPDVRFSDAGKCWMKIRCLAKDRKRDSQGNWGDGDPLFIDVLVFGEYATHLADSVTKGDTILVRGKLTPNKWTDKEGNEREEIRVIADQVGPSVRWGAAKTQNMSSEAMSTSQVAASLGATEQAADAPF